MEWFLLIKEITNESGSGKTSLIAILKIEFEDHPVVKYSPISIHDALFKLLKVTKKLLENNVDPDQTNHQEGRVFPSPVCQLCGQPLHLVVQLYCPLQLSDFHRTLYVFACSCPSCWNKPESWLVYRSQTKIEQPQTTPTPVSSAPLQDDWGGDCDDWGSDAGDWWMGKQSWLVYRSQTKIELPQTTPTPVSSAPLQDDWGGDCDDWGSDAGDWGTEDCETEVDIVGGKMVNDDDSFGGKSVEFDGKKKISGQIIPTENQEGDTNETECDLQLETMCIEDAEDGYEEKQPSHVITEDLPSISGMKTEFLSKLGPSTENHGNNLREFESYFINVFDEADVMEDKDIHVSKLLKEYEKREGYSVKEVAMEMSSAGGDREKYEKTSLQHRDMYFHRFMKQIALCPEQCIRYSWNGSPLYMGAPDNLQISSRCKYCTGEMVFELQLMPALVNMLKFPKCTDAAIEFGTVLVFTCKQSCWVDGDLYRTECIMVQSDCDQHRFDALPK